MKRTVEMMNRNKILILLGLVLFICLIIFRAFAILAIAPCALAALIYGVKTHDRPFIIGSACALGVGIVGIVYTIFLIYSM